jgi:hypothetical protein
VNKEEYEAMEIFRVERLDLEGWLGKHLLPTDRVVIESTTNAWHVYDRLEPLVTEVLSADLLRDAIVLLQCFKYFLSPWIMTFVARKRTKIN